MIFAKIAANLDSNPKIRKAGRDGREVFLFLLRKNAELDLNGAIPVSLAEPWYLADQLMMDDVTAGHGLSRCVQAGLLSESDGQYAINGWDDEWAKRPLTDAERKRKSREKTKTSDGKSRDVTTPIVTNRDGHACHALDQSREDKIRVEEKRKEVASPPARAGSPAGNRPKLAPDPRLPPVVAAFDAEFRAANDGIKPTWGDKQGKQLKRLIAAHGPDEVIRRIGVLFRAPPSWLKPPFDVGTLEMHFDKLTGSQQRIDPLMRIAQGLDP